MVCVFVDILNIHLTSTVNQDGPPASSLQKIDRMYDQKRYSYAIYNDEQYKPDLNDRRKRIHKIDGFLIKYE